MTSTAPPVRFELNGSTVEVGVDAGAPLLHVLRNDLHCHGPRFGCGLEQCGSCTVLVDGKAKYACTLPLAAVAGRHVTTVEGLPQRPGGRDLLDAFEARQAVQCGYCASGILMRATELLESNPAPDESEVRAALDANLCRCGAHLRMIRAVLDAAERRRG